MKRTKSRIIFIFLFFIFCALDRAPAQQDLKRDERESTEYKSIPPDYDSLVAKIIAFAPSRQLTIKKMETALEMMTVVGIKTNIPLHLNILTNSDFISGNYNTQFLERILQKNSQK